MKNYYDVNRIYKDSMRKKLSGVCAGCARYFGMETWVVRLITIMAFMLLPVPVAIAYVMAAILLPTR